MFIRSVLYFLVFFLPVYASAQKLIDRPEQDCTGALPICDSLFTQTASYTGPGVNKNELPNNTCLLDGENNSVWYVFTTTGAGFLQFILSPINDSDDYDFALFNITGHTCADIRTDPSLEVRCNYTLNNAFDGNGFTTGIGHGGTGDSSPAQGPPFNAADTVTATPQTFVLLVNDFTSGGSGYTLDFTGSTTFIVDSAKPKIIALDSSLCNTPTDSIVLQFSRTIQCDSVVPNGSQFTITGPAPSSAPVPIDSAYSNSCTASSTAFTSTIVIRLKTPITASGNYSVSMHASDIASGNSHIIDICGHDAADTTWTFYQQPILKPNFTWTFSPACHVDTVNYTTTFVAGDSIFYWSFGDGTFSTDTIPPPHVYPDTATYTVTLTDSSGSCTADTTINVHVSSTFHPQFTGVPNPVCAGSPIVFSDDSIPGDAATGTSYFYDIGGKFFVNPPNHDTTYTFAQPGIDTAQLIVETVSGQTCPDTVTLVITVDSLVSANFIINPQVVCQGTPIAFTDASTGAATAWLWNFGTGTSSTEQNVSYTYDSIGSFKIVFTASNICSSSDTSLNITVKKVPSFSLGPDTSICLPDSVLLVAYPGADSIKWSTGDTTETIYFKNVPNTVSVRVVKNGCPFETSIMIGEQENNCIMVNLPSAFTPNGDGTNDLWRLVHPERIQDVDIKVYNRWGQLVYHGTDPEFAWDGTFNGEKAPMAVYTWFAVVTGLSGQNEFFKGNLTLIR